MGYRNREIEIKLKVSSNKTTRINMENLSNIIQKGLINFKKEVGSSTDLYYYSPFNKSAFIRLRKSGKKSQITTKIKDRDSILDRVEIDLEITDPKQAEIFLDTVFKQKAGEITKKYIVFILENEFTTISIYKVLFDVFIEIEATTIKRILELEDKITKSLNDSCNLKRIDKSLFEMYIGNEI